MEEEDIMTQDEDDLELEMKNIEKEEAIEKEATKKTVKKPATEIAAEESTETYEVFSQPAHMGIVDTITGEAMAGFDQKRDEGLVQVLKLILNKLDKIGIASGV